MIHAVIYTPNNKFFLLNRNDYFQQVIYQVLPSIYIYISI